MKKLLLYILIVGLSLAGCQNTSQKKTDLISRILKEFPEAKIDTLENKDGYQVVLDITIQQFLDHNNKEEGTFDHHLYLYHVSDNANVYLETEGYRAYKRPREISQELGLNQLIVEYRFYGNSAPDPVPWQYLMNDQAVEDYHRIREAFEKVYPNKKWVVSGISKGGETTMIYKSKYPNDMDAIVPYVAPIILDTMDTRVWTHINSIGSEECRAKIDAFQELVLSRKPEMLAELKKMAAQDSVTFAIGEELALEYSILEYPFSFWQWYAQCENIPDASASNEEIFEHLDDVVGVKVYSDQRYQTGMPSYYQHMREYGYYGMETTGLTDWLSQDMYSHRIFAPKNTDLSYNPDYMPTVKSFIESEENNNMILIGGALDPWGALMPEPNPNTNSMKLMKQGGTHGARIRSFSDTEQKQVYDSLRKWLDIKN